MVLVDANSLGSDGEEVILIDLTSFPDLNPPDSLQKGLSKATRQLYSEEVESNMEIQGENEITQDPAVDVQPEMVARDEGVSESEDYYNCCFDLMFGCFRVISNSYCFKSTNKYE